MEFSCQSYNNFDSRDEVAALVKDVKRDNLPAEISWHYDRNIMAKKNHKVPLRSSSDQEFIKFEKRGRRLDTVKRAWQTNPQGAFE